MGDSEKGGLDKAQSAALDRVDWREMRRRLENFARALGASSSAADDAVHTAVKQLYAGATDWHPAAHPDVTRHLMRAVRQTLSNARQSALVRREVPSEDLDEEAAPASDRAAREREARASAAVVRLRTAVASDPLALAVVELVAEGVDKPAAQAARLGRPRGEIYDARDRIAYHLRRIAERDAQDDEEEVAQ
jgi:hypothetical protein